jgi:hypothetical protein
MIHDHKFYEMQSALAATGQLTDAELTELEQHATTCASCRECIADMAEMSREFFLMQVGRMKSKGTPAGMQERFLERAANAGMSVSRSSSTPFDPRLLRVAVIAVILAISTSLTWKVFLAPDAERKAAAPDSSTAGSQPATTSEGTPHIVGERAIQHVSISKAQLRRRSASRRSAVSISPAHAITKERQSYFELNKPLFAKQGSPMSFSDGSAFWSARLAADPLAAGLHAPTRTSFTSAYVASCFGHEEDCKPKEQPFHLELKLASLTFLGSPQSIDAETPIPSLKFSAPVFHLDPSRVW